MKELRGHQPGFTRRRIVQAGGLACLGMAAPALLAPAAGARSRPASGTAARIRSCIVLFYYGGPSHLDTWDPKPNAPREVRGEFQSIASRVPGIHIGEHAPCCARIMDKLAIIRSMRHPMRNHNSAAVEMLCGRTPLKGDLELLADDAEGFPCYGAALSYLVPGRGAVPNHVALPHVMYNIVVLPGQTGGFLGAAHNPFQVSKDPNESEPGGQDLDLPQEMSSGRLEERRNLLAALETGSATAAQRSKRAMEVYQERAFRLLGSEAARRAFDLSQESPALRERYGRNKLGQSLLLARRLVEAGVRFVNVNDKVRNGQLDNWDSHENNFGRLKNDLMPPADRAFAALIEDLELRGLLDSTLVIALAEFGRTPKINGKAGRDHWPDCYSIVLAGGGIRGGAIHGASDKIGAYPALDPVTPGDLAATLFWRFGLDPQAELRDRLGRPYRLAEGEPLVGLFA
jgi:Protein of unknown function (DUF1501)